MKDGLGPEAIERIAKNIEKAAPDFSGRSFVEGANCGLRPLELKDRVHHVGAALRGHLAPDWPKALAQLRQARENWDRGDLDDPLRGFAAWPVIDLIGAYGLATPEDSLDALVELTGLFTAEFAIRPFLAECPVITFERLFAWAFHEDPAVRRLVSEGTRPRLPWGKRVPSLDENPEVCLHLLEFLKDDVDETVRRSVANHLNDWSKIRPDWTAGVLVRWWAQGDETRRKLLRHASRTLVKTGHPEILAMLGKTGKPELSASRLKVSPSRLVLGQTLILDAELVSATTKRQHLVVDFVIHHVGARGQVRPKVFKWKEITLEGGQTLALHKKHSIRPISTRNYHGGKHAVELLVNGAVVAAASFELVIPQT
jgi:3-methyladenine DNA glycosylase AlkC